MLFPYPPTTIPCRENATGRGLIPARDRRRRPATPPRLASHQLAKEQENDERQHGRHALPKPYWIPLDQWCARAAGRMSARVAQVEEKFRKFRVALGWIGVNRLFEGLVDPRRNFLIVAQHGLVTQPRLSLSRTALRNLGPVREATRQHLVGDHRGRTLRSARRSHAAAPHRLEPAEHLEHLEQHRACNVDATASDPLA
jgi:hypothetical protein